MILISVLCSLRPLCPSSTLVWSMRMWMLPCTPSVLWIAAMGTTIQSTMLPHLDQGLVIPMRSSGTLVVCATSSTCFCAWYAYTSVLVSGYDGVDTLLSAQEHVLDISIPPRVWISEKSTLLRCIYLYMGVSIYTLVGHVYLSIHGRIYLYIVPMCIYLYIWRSTWYPDTQPGVWDKSSATH